MTSNKREKKPIIQRKKAQKEMRNCILSKNINKTKHKNLKKHPKASFQTKAVKKPQQMRLIERSKLNAAFSTKIN